HGGCQLAEREASVGPVLAVAVPSVTGMEETELDGVAAADPGEILGEVEVATRIAAPESAAPAAIGREVQLRKRAIGTRSIRDLELLIPAGVRIEGAHHDADAFLLLIADSKSIQQAAPRVIPGNADRAVVAILSREAVEWIGNARRTIG